MKKTLLLVRQEKRNCIISFVALWNYLRHYECTFFSMRRHNSRVQESRRARKRHVINKRLTEKVGDAKLLELLGDFQHEMVLEVMNTLKEFAHGVCYLNFWNYRLSLSLRLSRNLEKFCLNRFKTSCLHFFNKLNKQRLKKFGKEHRKVWGDSKKVVKM